MPPHLVERVPDLGNRPVAVVGHAVRDDRHPAGAEALVADLLETPEIAVTARPADGPLDRVLGDVAGEGLVDRLAEARVPVEARPADPGRDRDLADEAGKQPAPPGVLGALAVLDVGPLAVSRHGARCEFTGGPARAGTPAAARVAGIDEAEYHRSGDPSTPGGGGSGAISRKGVRTDIEAPATRAPQAGFAPRNPTCHPARVPYPGRRAGAHGERRCPPAPDEEAR